MSSVAAPASGRRVQDFFAEKGLEYTNKSAVSKEARNLWKSFCSSHEDRVSYDSVQGWNKGDRLRIKELQTKIAGEEDRLFDEYVRFEETAEKVRVYAKKAVERGTLLAIYAGETMTTSEAIALGYDNPYLFTATRFPGDEQVVINALVKGNWTRYLGHLTKPNLEACLTSGVVAPSVVFRATRPIEEGEEFTIDYGFAYCEKFGVTYEESVEKSAPSPSKAKKMAREERRAFPASEEGILSPTNKRKVTRWNDDQFLIATAYDAIAKSTAEERRTYLRNAINEQRALNGITKIFSDEDVHRLFVSKRLDWVLRENISKFGWM
jgi:hypothetical protein